MRPSNELGPLSLKPTAYIIRIGTKTHTSFEGCVALVGGVHGHNIYLVVSWISWTSYSTFCQSQSGRIKVKTIHNIPTTSHDAARAASGTGPEWRLKFTSTAHGFAHQSTSAFKARQMPRRRLFSTAAHSSVHVSRRSVAAGGSTCKFERVIVIFFSVKWNCQGSIRTAWAQISCII